MKTYKKAGRILSMAILLLSVNALTGCWPVKPDTILLPPSQVQKMLKGDSANFDGYLLTNAALVKLLERAEGCVPK